MVFLVIEPHTYSFVFSSVIGVLLDMWLDGGEWSRASLFMFENTITLHVRNYLLTLMNPKTPRSISGPIGNLIHLKL